ncbi:MAG: hypothetical protein JXR97_06780 [Planctomycetes bacterium]|nr:hypothetical protein [Planctomycetota bacterium]
MENFLRAALMILALLACGAAPCSESRIEAEAFLTPRSGTECRPGAWNLARVTLNISLPSKEELIPELALQGMDGLEPFSSRLPASIFDTGEHNLDFWFVASRDMGGLEFRLLKQNGDKAFTKSWSSSYSTAHDDTRLILTTSRLRPVMENNRFVRLSPRDLPSHGALYENFDLIILSADPKDRNSRISKSQFLGIAQWITMGGIVIALDKSSADGTIAAVDNLKLNTGMPFPFLIRNTKAEGFEIFAPPARKIGLGMLIDLSPIQSGQSMILSGSEVWKELSRRHLSPRASDPRLARTRYARLDNWPDKPRLKGATLARWIAAWAALSLACLAIPAVRKNRWLCALCVSAVSIAVAWRFGEANPVPETNLIHATIRIVGETGNDGPSIDEDVWLARRFSPTDKASLPFSLLPPPRLTGPNVNWLEDYGTTLSMNSDQQSGIINIYPLEINSALNAPLIFSRHDFGPTIPEIQALCVKGEGWVSIKSERGGITLEDAVIKTSAGKISLGRYDGGNVGQTSYAIKHDADLPRPHFFSIIEPEHNPGLYAILAGWTGNKDENDLGEIQIHTLNAIAAPE